MGCNCGDAVVSRKLPAVCGRKWSDCAPRRAGEHLTMLMLTPKRPDDSEFPPLVSSPSCPNTLDTFRSVSMAMLR